MATGIDLAPAAIESAKKNFPEVRFFVQDILAGDLNEKFDFLFDRGCFHVFSEQDLPQYIQSVSKLLPVGGLFFLKTFSRLQSWDMEVPHRYATDDIRQLFNEQFELLSSTDTIYQGTMPEKPKALFCVLRKR